MNEKKFIISLVFISLSFSSFLGGYLVTHKGLENHSKKTAYLLDKFQTPEPTSKESKKVVNLSLEQVVSSVILADTVRFVSKNGQIIEIYPKDSTPRIVSNIIIPNIMGAIWAKNGGAVAYFVNEYGGNLFNLLDLKQNKIIKLNNSIRSLDFSPDGNRMAYFAYENNIGSIVISHLEEYSSKKIFTTRLSDVELLWISDNILSIKTTRSNDEIFDLFTLDTQGHLKKVLEDKEGLRTLWTKDGQQLLYSFLDGNGSNKLYVFNSISGENYALNISGLANKCSWSVDNLHVFCAIQDNSGLESIFSIDAREYSKHLLKKLDTGLAVEKLWPNSTESYFFILNNLDKKMYKVLLD